MTTRIQAYFRTESEAEGAKTALIPYGVEGIEVSELTDPLDKGDHRSRNILLPFVPYNNSAMTGGAYGVAGATGTVSGAAIVPGIGVDNDLGDNTDTSHAGDVRSATDVDDRDLSDVNYVMDLRVPEAKRNEVVEVLRGKQAFVEIFEA
ncbi:hypothetical protein [Paenibacillus jilunlii]|uniref:Heat induced stress protein YflT n=1 Tax=Paenibacillus jilunlii TaxID=682956 RepID=A0A1G9V705_9BACL|nr:hypothetical protein [Paenibacillus jilunlii]KWX76899.1 hypothetical protein AML91_08905 [Paenibacillus jilunlii]SDM67880.1 hypothetical protein SAMN05216191_11658 [Paenibacillus jilunlii]